MPEYKPRLSRCNNKWVLTLTPYSVDCLFEAYCAFHYANPETTDHWEFYVWDDGDSVRVRPDAEHEAALQCNRDNAWGIPCTADDEAAQGFYETEARDKESKWCAENVSFSACNKLLGISLEECVAAVKLRWEMIKLIVDPAITLCPVKG